MGQYVKLFRTHDDYEEYKREHPVPAPPEPPVIHPIQIPGHIIKYEATSKLPEKILSNSSGIYLISFHPAQLLVNDFNNGVGTLFFDKDINIDGYAFSNSYTLISIEIPSGVTNIGYGAFSRCSNLTSIEIPSSVTKIGNYAFSGCTSLISVTIPDSIISIDDYSFKGCSGLTGITIDAQSPPYLGTGAFVDTNDCPIYVPSERVNTYKTASGWSTYADRIRPNDPGYAERWVDDGTECFSFDLCVLERLEISHDSGQTWEETSETRKGALIESKSTECGYDPSATSIITYRAYNKLTETTSNKTAGLKTDAFDANIISHTFENGVGTIEFDGIVTSIGDSAFYGAPIIEIVLPNTITSIGKMALYSGSTVTLSKLTIEAEIPPFVDNHAITSPTTSYNAIVMTSAGKIYVPSDSVNAYKSESTWLNYASKIQPIS